MKKINWIRTIAVINIVVVLIGTFTKLNYQINLISSISLLLLILAITLTKKI